MLRSSKKSFRFTSLMLAVLIAVMAIVAPVASAQGTNPPTPTNPQSVLQFFGIDRIAIDIDNEGQPSLMGVPLISTAASLGVDMSGFQLDESLVARFTDSNIQHVEMRMQDTNILLFVNGVPMPFVSWDDSRLEELAAVAKVVSPTSESFINIAKNAYPIVKRLGVALVVNFPRKSGTAMIPMSEMNADLPSVAITADKIKVNIELQADFDEVGVPEILGMSARDLNTLGLSAPLAISAPVYAEMQDLDIQNAELRVRGDGAWVYVNNKMLMHLAYDRALLGNMADVFVKIDPTSPYKDMVVRLANNIHRMNVGLMATFAPMNGAEPIELLPHPWVPSAVSVVVGAPAQAAVVSATPTPVAPKGVIGGQNGGGGPW